MSEPSAFLNAFGHALAVIAFYPDGHPLRERAVETAHDALRACAAANGSPCFTFLDDEVICGHEPLKEMKSWSWGRRLVAAGVQRLEFDREVTRDAFEAFLFEMLARLTLSVVAGDQHGSNGGQGISFGAVGLQGLSDASQAVLPAALPDVATSFDDEVETLQWLQRQAENRGTVPIAEAEAVVRSLSVAMHGHRHVVVPLLQLKEFDQYTTTHSINVGILSMGLAEALGAGAREVRAIGVAGLLHDIGKIRIPREVLAKAGRLSDAEMTLVRQHPAEGARLIMQSHDGADLAAIVAYEHHVMVNGDGYPVRGRPATCAAASRLVHVCDVYDALRTRRPYRDAWPSEKIVGYLQERTGVEFDAQMVAAFVRMLREGDLRAHGA